MRFSHLTSTIGSPRARNPATPTACGSNRQCDPPDNTRRRARSFRRREGGTRRSRNGPGGREARHAPTGECLRRVTGPGSAARVRIRRERSTQTRMIRNKCSPYSHAAPPPFGVNPLTVRHVQNLFSVGGPRQSRPVGCIWDEQSRACPRRRGGAGGAAACAATRVTADLVSPFEPWLSSCRAVEAPSRRCRGTVEVLSRCCRGLACRVPVEPVEFLSSLSSWLVEAQTQNAKPLCAAVLAHDHTRDCT